ncbi:hypothetical protein D3C85_1520120 [compost metagenome]
MIRIKEVKAGYAFKRNDIVDIKVASVLSGSPPSCIWTMKFDAGNTRTLEIDYQAYFTYGSVARPKNMMNADILMRVFPSSDKK